MPIVSDSDDGFLPSYGQHSSRAGRSQSPRNRHVLTVHVLEGRRLRSKIPSEGVNSFVVLNVGGKREQTVPKRSSRAFWDEAFNFPVQLGSSSKSEYLRVELWNVTNSGRVREEMLGDKSLQLRQIQEMFQGGDGHWFTLSNSCGQIKLQLDFKSNSNSNKGSRETALEKINAALRRAETPVTLSRAGNFLTRVFRTRIDRELIMRFARRERWTSSTELSAKDLLNVHTYLQENGQGHKVSTSRDESSASGETSYIRGEKVEARFGQGTAFYPGKVSRVHRDGTYDIDYDDGDAETHVSASLIRKQPSREKTRTGSRSPRRSAHSKVRSRPEASSEDEYTDADFDGENDEKDDFDVGQRVEARFRGGSTYFKGKVTRVKGRGVYTILYDDGDIETSVPSRLIRPLRSSSASTTINSDGRERRRGSNLHVGDKVEARFKGGKKYYPGTLSRRNRDDSWAIRYDDGDIEDSVRSHLIRKVNAKDDRLLQSGDTVQVFDGSSRNRHKSRRGKILRINRDGSYNIRYHSGNIVRNVEPSRVQPISSDNENLSSDEDNRESRRSYRDRPSTSHRSQRSASRRRINRNLSRGDRVRLRSGHKRSHSSHVNEAEIIKIHLDGSCDLLQDNGQRLDRVEPTEFTVVQTSSSDDSTTARPKSRSRSRSRSKSKSISNHRQKARSRSTSRSNSDSDSSYDRQRSARPRGKGGSRRREGAKRMKRPSKEDSVWASLRKLAMQEGRVVPRLSDVLAEENETRRMEGVLGRKRLRELRRAFDKYDRNGDGVITATEVKKTLMEMGTSVDDRDIRKWVLRRDLNRDGVIDFLEFLDAYAVMNIEGESDSSSSGSEAKNVDSDDAEQNARNGEERSCQKWRKEPWAIALGDRQLKRVRRAFDELSVVRRDGNRALHMRHMRQAFGSLEETCSSGMIVDYMNAMGFTKDDAVSFAEFAHAYHWLFHSGETTSAGGMDGQAISRREAESLSRRLRSLSTKNHEVEGSIGAVAARLFQNGEFRGTREEHGALLRMLMVGRSSAEISTLKRIFAAFEQADSDEDGEIDVGEVAKVLRSAEVNPGPLKHILAEFASHRRVTTMPELLATVGFAISEQSRSVASCFAVLRLHHDPGVVREVANFVLRILQRILENPDDARRWDVSATSSAFKATLGHRKGGLALLTACGFTEAPSKRWFRLAAATKGRVTLGDAEVSRLSVRREEVAKELALLDGGMKSLSDTLRLLDCTEHQAYKLLELLSRTVTNVLKHPKDPRQWRLRAEDPLVKSAFDGFDGKTKAAAHGVMETIGFKQSADGRQFVLETAPAGDKEFRFPRIDQDFETALWRRKGEIDSMLREVEARLVKHAPNIHRDRTTLIKNTRPGHSQIEVAGLRNFRQQQRPWMAKSAGKEEDAKLLELRDRLERQGSQPVQVLRGIGKLRLLNSREMAQMGARRMIAFTTAQAQRAVDKPATLLDSVAKDHFKAYHGFEWFLQAVGWKRDAMRKMYQLESQIVHVRIGQLEPHLLALGRKDLADFSAIKAAVVAMTKDQPARTQVLLKACMETIGIYVENILLNPAQARFRTINTQNHNFRRRVASCAEGLQLMVACGFREAPGGLLIFPQDADLEAAQVKLKELRAALPLIKPPPVEQTNPPKQQQTQAKTQEMHKKANRPLIAAQMKIQRLEKQVRALQTRGDVPVESPAKGSFRLSHDLMPTKLIPWNGRVPWDGPAKLRIGDEERFILATTPQGLELDSPLTLSYTRGSLVTFLRPKRKEIVSIAHRAVIRMIRDEFVADLIDEAIAASVKGERNVHLRQGKPEKLLYESLWHLRLEDHSVLRLMRVKEWTCVLSPRCLSVYEDSTSYWTARFAFVYADRAGNGVVTAGDLVRFCRHCPIGRSALHRLLPQLRALSPGKNLDWKGFLSILLPGTQMQAKDSLDQSLEVCYILLRSAKGRPLSMDDFCGLCMLLDGEDFPGFDDDRPGPLSLGSFKRLREELGRLRAGQCADPDKRRLLCKGYGLVDIACSLRRYPGCVECSDEERELWVKGLLQMRPPRWAGQIHWGPKSEDPQDEAIDLQVVEGLSRAYVLTKRSIYVVDLQLLTVVCSKQVAAGFISSSSGIIGHIDIQGELTLLEPLTLRTLHRLKAVAPIGSMPSVMISVASPVVVIGTTDGLTTIHRNGHPLSHEEGEFREAVLLDDLKCVAFVDKKNRVKLRSFAVEGMLFSFLAILLFNRELSFDNLETLETLQLPVAKAELNVVRNATAEIMRVVDELQMKQEWPMSTDQFGDALIAQLSKLDKTAGGSLVDILSEFKGEAVDEELKSAIEASLGIWIADEEWAALSAVCSAEASKLHSRLIAHIHTEEQLVEDLEGQPPVVHMDFLAHPQILTIISADATARLYRRSQNEPVSREMSQCNGRAGSINESVQWTLVQKIKLNMDLTWKGKIQFATTNLRPSGSYSSTRVLLSEIKLQQCLEHAEHSIAVVYVIQGRHRPVTVYAKSAGSISSDWITLEDETALALQGFPVVVLKKLALLKPRVWRVLVLVADDDGGSLANAISHVERGGLAKQRLDKIQQSLHGVQVVGFYGAGDGPERELDCDIAHAPRDEGYGDDDDVDGAEKTCIEDWVLDVAIVEANREDSVLSLHSICRSKAAMDVGKVRGNCQNGEVRSSHELLWKLLKEKDSNAASTLFKLLCVHPTHWGPRYFESRRLMNKISQAPANPDWLEEYLNIVTSSNFAIEGGMPVSNKLLADNFFRRFASTLSMDEVIDFFGRFGISLAPAESTSACVDEEGFRKVAGFLLEDSPFKPALSSILSALKIPVSGFDNSGESSVLAAETAHAVGKIFSLHSRLKDLLCVDTMRCILHAKRRQFEEMGRPESGISAIPLYTMDDEVLVVESGKPKPHAKSFTGSGRLRGRAGRISCEVWLEPEIGRIWKSLCEGPHEHLFPRLFPHAVFVNAESNESASWSVGELCEGRTLGDVLLAHGPPNDEKSFALLSRWLQQLLEMVVAMRAAGCHVDGLGVDDIEVIGDGSALRIISMRHFSTASEMHGEDCLFRVMLCCISGLNASHAYSPRIFFQLQQMNHCTPNDLAKSLQEIQALVTTERYSQLTKLGTLLALCCLQAGEIAVEDVLESGLFATSQSRVETSVEAYKKRGRFTTDIQGLTSLAIRSQKASVALHVLQQFKDRNKTSSRAGCSALHTLRETILRTSRDSPQVLSAFARAAWNIAKRASSEEVVSVLEAVLYVYTGGFNSVSFDATIEQGLRETVEKLCGLHQVEVVINAATSRLKSLACVYKQEGGSDEFLPSADYIQFLVTLGANLSTLTSTHCSPKRQTACARQVVENLISALNCTLEGMEAHRAVKHMGAMQIVAGWIHFNGPLQALMLEFMEQASMKLDRDSPEVTKSLEVFASPGVVGKMAGILRNGHLPQRLTVQAIIKAQQDFPALTKHWHAVGIQVPRDRYHRPRGDTEDEGFRKSKDAVASSRKGRTHRNKKPFGDGELLKLLDELKRATEVDDVAAALVRLERAIIHGEESALLDAALLHLWSCTFTNFLQKIISNCANPPGEKMLANIVNHAGIAVESPHHRSSLFCEGGAMECFQPAFSLNLPVVHTALARLNTKLCRSSTESRHKAWSLDAFNNLLNNRKSASMELLQAMLELWSALVDSSHESIDLKGVVAALFHGIGRASAFHKMLLLGSMQVLSKNQEKCHQLVDSLHSFVDSEAHTLRVDLGEFEVNLLQILASFRSKKLSSVLQLKCKVPPHMLQQNEEHGIASAVRWLEWSKHDKVEHA